jgi:hypothetical protein
MSAFGADFRRTTPFEFRSDIFLQPENILRSAAGHER